MGLPRQIVCPPRKHERSDQISVSPLKLRKTVFSGADLLEAAGNPAAFKHGRIPIALALTPESPRRFPALFRAYPSRCAESVPAGWRTARYTPALLYAPYRGGPSDGREAPNDSEFARPLNDKRGDSPASATETEKDSPSVPTRRRNKIPS